MTKLFEQAVGKVSQLPDTEQDEIARMLLKGLEEDRRWNETTARSASKLADIAKRAWNEHERGESEELDPNKL